MTLTVSTLEAELLVRVRATQRRLRWGGVLRCLARLLPGCLLVLTPLSLAFRAGWVPSPVLFAGGLGVLALVAVRVRSAWAGAPSELGAALLLDRTYDLKGRLATTWEYIRDGRGLADARADRTEPGFLWVVEQELFAAGPVSPARAAPMPLPRGIVGALLLCGVLLGVLLVPLPQSPDPSSVVSAPIPARTETWVSEDDGELLQRAADRVTEKSTTEQGRDAAARFNDIVLRVVSGELTQQQAFQLAAQLQADLNAVSEQAEELRRGLQKRGESLARRTATRNVGKALSEQRFEDAADALAKLAERLESGDQGLSAQELEELRQALEELREQQMKDASQGSEDAPSTQHEALSRRKQELEDKQKQGALSAKEKQELSETDRQLKRLDRQTQKQQSGARKELSELDKQLAEAAKALAEEQKKAGEFLNQAGRSVSQAAQRTLSDEEKKEVLKQLKELKERLRRKQAGGDQAERLRDFQKRARGQRGDAEEGQQGKPGGDGQGQQGQTEVQLGPDGIPLPGTGAPGEGEGDGEGEGEAEQRQAGSSSQPGHGHDPNLAGAAKRLDQAKTQDALAVAQDSGQGTSASETIVTAAEEGFTRGAYAKLFREYETVAEEVMEREAIPPGRKAHVARYFELIRPRGDAPLPQKVD